MSTKTCHQKSKYFDILSGPNPGEDVKPFIGYAKPWACVWWHRLLPTPDAQEKKDGGQITIFLLFSEKLSLAPLFRGFAI